MGVSAIAQVHRRGRLATYVIGSGDSEIEALLDLEAKLIVRPDASGAIEELRARQLLVWTRRA